MRLIVSCTPPCRHRVLMDVEDAMENEWLFNPEREDSFIDNLLVRNHFIIVMIRWTGLAPWELEFP